VRKQEGNKVRAKRCFKANREVRTRGHGEAQDLGFELLPSNNGGGGIDLVWRRRGVSARV
jgi:hypothetical protein